MRFNRRFRRQNGNESGYILLAILLLVTFMAIALAAEMPSIATEIKRQREEELIHRGNQYKRAIQLYFRKYGRYPVSIEQLENTNNIRFLRKRYKDPMTHSEDWKLLHIGDALAIKNSKIAGATPASQMGSPFGGANSSSSSPFSSGPQGAPGSNSSANGQPGPSGAAGNDLNRVFGGPDPNSGGPIVGVASTSTKESLKVLNDKDHYNDWQFVYDPTQDHALAPAGAVGVPGAAVPGASPFNNGASSSPNPGGIGLPQSSSTPNNPQNPQ